MKKHLFSDSVTSDMGSKTVAWRAVRAWHLWASPIFYYLYILYIFNGNNVTMSLAFICRPFKHDIILTLSLLRRLCHSTHPHPPFRSSRCHFSGDHYALS